MKSFAATLLLGTVTASHHYGSYSRGLRSYGGYSGLSRGLRYSSSGLLRGSYGLRPALRTGGISLQTANLIKARAGGRVLGSGLRLARGLRLGAVAVPVRRVDLVPETVIAKQARTVLDAVQRQVTELQT